MAPEVGSHAADYSRLVRDRLCEFESGKLGQVLQRYAEDSQAATLLSTRAATLRAAALPLQPMDDEQLLRKAADKLGAGAIRTANALLMAVVKTPLTEDTAARIDELVGVTTDAEEDHELQDQCRQALVGAHLAPPPQTPRHQA